MKNKRIGAVLLITAIVLLVPFIAMQFTEEVNWTLLDFVVAGTLLLLTGLGCEFTWRKVKFLKHRLLICAAILILFLLVWVELAVGIV